MILAELKLRIPRNHHVVILPNDSALAPIHGLDDLMPASRDAPRPLEALRINDIVEDCELVDRDTGDRFNIPAGVGYRVRQLDVEPLAANAPMRIYTLVRVK